ncbi:hypothetical protein [Rhodococcus sp. OK302]|uniref:hypothetical protein n=1 Tax=Rhodococcus sp. OK302 TaxID=1882769 RepID=UPI000B94511D|nr:hypothetical protein [Rhodococcus sp. OK302]OYD70034.1 hypothetical protein BDB13_3624 [Rhodococcus sp. OK302]
MTESLRTPTGRRYCAGIAILGILSLAGAPAASAAPTDSVLAIPIAGVATGVTGLYGEAFSQFITARTDTDTPGITQFLGGQRGCACVVHWRNLSTGLTGDTFAGFDPSPVWASPTAGIAATGSGVLVATATVSGAGLPITALPGAGVWTVP